MKSIVNNNINMYFFGSSVHSLSLVSSSFSRLLLLVWVFTSVSDYACVCLWFVSASVVGFVGCRKR
eukprot:m.203570 g.203570  ORF g.203570 m.203570 type:complete len:66 (+) comp13731_c8_seq2:43-240(+)